MFLYVDIVKVFCLVDDFCRQFESEWQKRLISNKMPECKLTMSEVLTVLILFQYSKCSCFKYYYKMLSDLHRRDFPNLLSYNRFVEIEAAYLVPLICFMKSQLSECTGTSYIDATPLKVCNNKRINQNKVFKKMAAIGKSTMGWFYGFKLHLIVNERGEPLNVAITKGNRDDRKLVKPLAKNIKGKLFGDKGYISQELFAEMLEMGLKIVTQIKKNMKAKLVEAGEVMLLKKRSVIESVFHVLKDILHMDHTRHRSPINFLINFFGAIAAYTIYPHKPHINVPAFSAPRPALVCK